MYTAKQAGKNRFAVFDPTMHAAIVARHAMSTELSHAVDVGEIDVYYQPVLSLATGVMYGVEALARWHHPTRGFIEPDEFIPLAEESGAILALGRAVLFEACREAAPWRDGTGDGHLADRQPVRRPARPGDVRRRPRRHPARDRVPGLGPGPRDDRDRDVRRHADDHRATHGAARPRRPDRGRRLRHRLLVAGLPAPVQGRHPQDRARVHRHVGDGPDGWAFAAAIVALGRSLGLRIIAEGIEEPTSSSSFARWAASSGRATCSRRRCRTTRWRSASSRRVRRSAAARRRRARPRPAGAPDVPALRRRHRARHRAATRRPAAGLAASSSAGRPRSSAGCSSRSSCSLHPSRRA